MVLQQIISLKNQIRGFWLSTSLLLALALCPQAFAASVSYTYDSLNRLTSIIYGNGEVVSYSYDKNGNRLTRTYTPPPTVVGPGTASGTLNQSFSYQITATNNPTSYGASGLPAGLSVNTSTGLISGTPTASGTFNVTVTATNNAGGTSSMTVSITIAAIGPNITVTIATAAPKIVELSAGTTSIFYPTGIATGSDGNLWFTEWSTGIGRITPAGEVTKFSVATDTSQNLYSITAGPDGNLWFTKVATNVFNRIGRITPTGVVTEFSDGISADAYPQGITAGPDGNLWFTEARGNRIGRITPDGVVTEFSAGISANAYPYGIAAGPDGNLWFTEYSGNRIGRITPTGVVTEFSDGITANAGPIGITAGPDGNLWFTESLGKRIGRITPAGVITEFSAGISAESQAPSHITAGPDGNLWFTEGGSYPNFGNRIGRITPAGVITEYSAGITPSAGPAGITAGPDGNLWFTEFWGNRIGRITPADGNGTVTSSPSGINCGSNCSASFASGTFVTLTATPDSGFMFAGWSGGECSGTGTCTVTMDTGKAITATFSTAAAKGDLNNDGKIDLADAIIAIQTTSNIIPTQSVHKQADVNGDEKIGLAEAVYALQYAAQLRKNHAPRLTAIGNKLVNEGSNLTFTISATDDDGDTLTYSAAPLPTGATFNSSTGTFSWTPTYTQSGNYLVAFNVRDDYGESVSETIIVTVGDAMPVFSTDYFPLNIGDWYDYNLNTVGNVKRNSITGTKTIGSVPTKVLSYWSGAKEYYTSDEGGVKLYGQSSASTGGADFIFETPLLLMPNNAQVGSENVSTYSQFWVYSGGTLQVDVTSTTSIMAIEDVQTEHTTLRDCMKVSIRIDQKIVQSGQIVPGNTVYYWFYKGIGCVKQVTGNNTYVITASSVNGVEKTY